MPILCGSDLSPGSADALATAIALGERRGDKEVILVHVAAPSDRPPQRDDDTHKSLSEQSDKLMASIPVRIEVRAGATAETLIALAREEGADLIVVGAGPRAAGRLGSFAGQLVETSSVPVLLVRDSQPWVELGRGSRALRLLAGIDDSATSDIGLHWLKALRQTGPVDVTLGAVYYPDEACDKYGLKLHSHVEREPEVEALLCRDLLHRFEPAVGSGTVEARVRLGLGRIGDHLLELATETKVDAIMVGTRQRTGLGKLGSVSSVVVENSPLSVVCIPPDAEVPIQTTPSIRSVLVATDLTPFANRAVPYAFSIAAGGEVHLLHVVSQDDPVPQQDLIAQLAALRPHGVANPVKPHVERGDDTAVRIAQTAGRLGVDIICIASHNRTGLGRALLGSVADRLLRETRIPVLILRPAP